MLDTLGKNNKDNVLRLTTATQSSTKEKDAEVLPQIIAEIDRREAEYAAVNNLDKKFELALFIRNLTIEVKITKRPPP